MQTLRWRPEWPCFTCLSLALSWKHYHNSMTFQVNIMSSRTNVYLFFPHWLKIFHFSILPESHNPWGRPGGPQGAAMSCTSEDAEGEANSLISQTVAMAIAGTSTASPISRPSSFLLNSQVIPVVAGEMFKSLTKHGASFVIVLLILSIFASLLMSRRVVNTVASRLSQVAVFSSVCCGYWRMLMRWCYRNGSQICLCHSWTACWISSSSVSLALSTR